MDAEEAFRVHWPEISRLSRSQWVPGLGPDDVAGEMVMALLKAARTYVPGTTAFGTYWWSVWCNHRTTLTRRHYALKRPVTVLAGDLVPEAVHVDPPPVQCPDRGVLARLVWQMLAQGDTPTEVREELGLSKRAYYDVIHHWRTDRMRRYLTER